MTYNMSWHDSPWRMTWKFIYRGIPIPHNTLPCASIATQYGRWGWMFGEWLSMHVFIAKSYVRPTTRLIIIYLYFRRMPHYFHTFLPPRTFKKVWRKYPIISYPHSCSIRIYAQKYFIVYQNMCFLLLWQQWCMLMPYGSGIAVVCKSVYDD